MSPRPPIVPTIAPARAITLPASFAACGVLVLILFVALVGCGQFLSLDDTITPNVRNAVLCSCECDGIVEVAVPDENFIKAGADGSSADDVTQTPAQPTAVSNVPVLTLGQDHHVGLRFLKLGVPPKAHIDAAYIQFSSMQVDASDPVLQISVVNAPHAPAFTAATNLREIDTIGQVNWTPLDWAANERDVPERSQDLSALVQTIVDRNGYGPDSAIAFVITGSNGRRLAFATESTQGSQPGLVVRYTPRKYTKEFLGCGDASTPAAQEAFCAQQVESNLENIAQQCKLASACTCKVSTRPNVDKTAFSLVCNPAPSGPGCPKVLPPADCDPDNIAKTTAATESHTPVCVTGSPLGSVLFGQLSACEIEGTPNCQSTDGDSSCVSVRVFDDDDSDTRYTTPRGRIEFAEKPCSPGSRCYGLTHRVHVNDVTFESSFFEGLFEGDHTLVELSGVGTSTVNAALNGSTGAGTFAGPWIKHSVRGRDGSDVVAVSKPGGLGLDINVGLGGYQSNGVCTLRGMVLKTDHIEMFANIRGRLVNQPPSAALLPESTVECNDKAPSRAAFTLDPTWHDPDGNVASFAWHRGSRKGPLIGTRPSIDLEQPLTPANEPPTSYWFKVIDELGQYAEATTKITVADTTKPIVTAPADRTEECSGHSGTLVNLGSATATDICDGSLPPVGNDAPALFPLGATTVNWSVRDASTNLGTATQTVTIVDTKPPTIDVKLSPAVLWSPDHKLVQITASITVEDKCDPNPSVKLLSIESNEPDNGLGDGDTSNDIQGGAIGTDDRTFLLRAERSGRGTGRVYTVTYETKDATGNTSTGQARVTVPKSQGR